MRPALEVADVFRRHGEAFRHSRAAHLGRVERRVMSAIEQCRTLARDLLCIVADERAELLDLQEVVAEFLPGAIEEMLAVGSGTRSTKPLYHARLETASAVDLTRDQQAHAIPTLERRLGLIDHARAVVECHTGDQDHLHVLWSRVDIDTMTVVPDSWNHQAHEDVARQLEREFGHACPPASARRW